MVNELKPVANSAHKPYSIQLPFSLFLFCSCLITAVMTDLWVHTVEPIATPKPPPHLRSLYEAAASVSLSSDSTPVDYRNPMAIDFDIGLWKVCPSVKEWIHSEYASKLVCFV